MVTVGELPPEFPVDGQTWWCSAGDFLTLYIYCRISRPTDRVGLGGGLAAGQPGGH